MEEDCLEFLSTTSPELFSRLTSSPRDETNQAVALAFRQFCRRLTREVGASERVEAVVPFSESRPYSLTSARFKQIISSQLDLVVESCARVLDEVRNLSGATAVSGLMVGGVVCLPFVRPLVEAATGLVFATLDEPDLVVCRGAAIGLQPDLPRRTAGSGSLPGCGVADVVDSPRLRSRPGATFRGSDGDP